MNRPAIALAGAALILSGCVDGAADFGTPHPVALVTVPQRLTVPANGSRASNLRLQRSISVIAQGNLQAVRAHVVAASAAQTRRVRETLIGMGLDPTRITEAVAASRSSAGATIILTRTTAKPTDCAAAIAPAFPDDPTPSLLNLSHCVQDSNLAAMVVDPADLIAPPKLGPTDGAYLASGVRSWRENRQSQLPAQNTSSGIDSGTATSTGSSLSSAPTAVTHSPDPNSQSQ